MKISELKDLLSRPDWARQQKLEVIDKLTHIVPSWREDGDEGRLVVAVWGWASLTSTLEGVKIVYTEQFNFEEGDPESFSASPEGQYEDPWSIEGVDVLDEDGNNLPTWEVAELLACQLQEFQKINYSVIAL